MEDMHKQVVRSPMREVCPPPPPPAADESIVDSVNHTCQLMNELSTHSKGERRRRKLPPTPVSRKVVVKVPPRTGSLAEELRATEVEVTPPADSGSTKLIRQVSDRLYLEIDTSSGQPKSCLRLYDRSLGGADSVSPEDSRSRLSLDTGVDSGNSTAHSPDGAKSLSPVGNGSPLSASSPSSTTTTSGSGVLQLHDATHRGLHRFVPRHADEVAIDIGDPVYVSKEADDAWCEGVNLRTGVAGVFPSVYVMDVDYSDIASEGQQVHKERYLLDFLGSVEVSCHKGSSVFCQAIRKVATTHASEVGVHGSHPCVLEVTDLGLRMVDRGRPTPNHVPTHDYFFNLKNVTFCGYHPTDHTFFGFITKHPLRDRFACHVFRAEASTREVAEAVGRAFRRFYQKFVEMAYPVEDIYIE